MQPLLWFQLKLLFQSIDVHRNGYFNKEDMHDLLEQMMGVKVGYVRS